MDGFEVVPPQPILLDRTLPAAGRYLVGGNARLYATTADGHAAIHLAASNCTGQRHNKIWIVIIRLRLPVAKVNHFIVSFRQPPDQIFLRLKSSMIGSDTD